MQRPQGFITLLGPIHWYNMVEDLQTGLINEFFAGGWRIAPFIKTPDGYIGVKAWPKRAAKNQLELKVLLDEQAAKSSRVPILGVVPSAGKFVVDIDTKNNPAALQIWRDKVFEAMGDASLAVPNLVVKTKSGGYHLYYTDGSDKLLHSPTSVFGKDSGVDIRGYTGMVVAPTAIGTETDWQAGEYVVIKGRPTDRLTVLPLSKILGDSYDEGDHFIKTLLTEVNEALRNSTVGELHRHKLLPDSLVIPSSSRDNTLYRCARLCRLAGLSQDAAQHFMQVIATRCETTPEEPVEHWIRLASDKVRRVYGSESEMKLQTISALYEELDNSGTVLLRTVSKSFYYFRHGSRLLRIEPRSMFSTDNIANVLQGIMISGDEETIPAKKVVGAYSPKEVAYNAAMYPKSNMPFFEFEGNRYVNTYFDPFATFEPNPALLEDAKPFVERFVELVRHITGYEEGDDVRLLNKLAWIVQKPYRKLPTGTIIYSHTRGSGKDVFMSLVREVVGRQYYMPIALSTLESNFVSIHDKLICTASEVQLQTNARGTMAAAAFMGKLKDRITAKSVPVEPKFQQPYNAPSFTNFFLLSNFELSAILEPSDRRFDLFHAAESKLDQARFGDLADISNDGVWLDRTPLEQEFRRHVIFALRQYLQNYYVSKNFDREEAVLNEVKKELVESQNPPALEWMYNNLPPHFTEDIAMVACRFCPMRAHPEYIMKQLKEHFGPRLQPVHRSGTIKYRMNGAPKLESRDDGSGSSVLVLNFETRTGDMGARKYVMTFNRGPRDSNPSDASLKIEMKAWYDSMVSRMYGMAKALPNVKPSGSNPELI